ncbi:hypothetical protein F0562_003570 [Nyssa sinensis]|uniref:Reverse transcriptase RNase H-like domain-containing protein n=1 Tax=Nyssa sinensis TaxID=561372 RepID=A0A5J5BWX2_9ASTE|nr:hypothetical protein F0562_003570 [Nyssa sinensis]
MQRSRAQGFCFNCNERVTTEHRCQKPQFLLLEGRAGNVVCVDITNQHTLEDNQGRDVAVVQEPELEPEITLHALTGWTAPRTIRMAAKMGPYKVVVQIDSGSIHYFISDRLTSLLRLPVVPTETFSVQVANGEKLKCQGHLDKLTMGITSHHLSPNDKKQGRKFFIQTDQRSLKYFLEQRVATPEQQKWVAKLMGYDYEITYYPSRENSATDTLSRKPNSPILYHLYVPVVTIWDEIRGAYEGDSYIQSVDRMAKAQPEGPYSQCQGLFFFERQSSHSFSRGTANQADV